MPVLTLTIENFLDIQCIATKSGYFAPNLLENKIPENFASRVLIVALTRQFSTPGNLVFFFNTKKI